jgi:hypothetical protein
MHFFRQFLEPSLEHIIISVFFKKIIKSIPKKLMEEIQKMDYFLDSRSCSHHLISDLFKNKEMTIITFIIMFQWLVNTMTYYGLTFGAGDLPGSVILNNTIGGVMEIGSQLLLILLMDRAWCGRKKCLIGLEFLASITCLACAVMYHPDMQENSQKISL